MPDSESAASSRKNASRLLQAQTRRHFLRNVTAGVGSMFLGTLGAPFAHPVNAAEQSVEGNADASISPAILRIRSVVLAAAIYRPRQADHLSAHGRARPANWSCSITSRI